MNIYYFGEIADFTNKTSEKIESIDSLDSLLNFLKSTYKLDETGLHIAINQSVVDKTKNLEINKTDEVAVLSPFAGG